MTIFEKLVLRALYILLREITLPKAFPNLETERKEVMNSILFEVGK